MFQLSISRLARILALVGLFAARATAQCGDWADGFHGSGPESNGTGLGIDPGHMAVFDDGSGPALYLGGTFQLVGGVHVANLAKWDGSTWTAVPNPFTTGIDALKTFDDGSGPALYVAGRHVTTPFRYFVAKWDGSSWTTLGTESPSPIYTLEALDDGSGPALFIGGNPTVGGTFTGVAKWSGTAWIPLGSFLFGGVYALGQFDDGTGVAIYAGGNFTSIGGTPANYIAKWNGTTWSALGSGLNAYVFSIRTFDSGTGPRLFVGGDFTTAGGSSVGGIAIWNGSSWSAMPGGAAPYWQVDVLDVQDDGSGPTLYAGGPFVSIGGVPANRIARWNGAGWSPLGAGVSSTPGYSSRVTALCRFDEGQGSRLFAAGIFQSSADVAIDSIGRWDGTSWTALTPRTTVDSFVRTFEAYDDGTGRALYAGGDFFTAGAHVANQVAKFDGASWTSLGSGLAGGSVYDLQPFDDGTGTQLYACGRFTNPTTGSGYRSIARWNGSTWSALPGADPDDVVQALAVFDAGSGPELYAGGVFRFVGGLSARGLAKWNGSTWTALGGGLANSLYSTAVGVYALTVWDDGTGPALFVGGQFDTAGGVHSGYIAKWNGTTWSSLANGLDGPNPSTMVRSLAVWDDGTGSALFAAGNFLGASNGAVPAVYLGKWNGTAWSTVGNGTDAEAHSLATYDDGTGHGPQLYIGGSFTDASGTAALHLARWDGASFSGVAGGFPASADVIALCGFGGDLYAGGGFFTAGTHDSKYFARLLGCGQTGELFCFGDGSGTACPCGNSSASADRAGCLNSLGVGAALRASGEPSLAHDSLVLSATSTTNGSVLYFQGSTRQLAGAGTPFGDGLRCAGGSARRLSTKTPIGGASQFPTGGDLALSVRGAVLSPGTRTYQARYRNSASFCTSASFNLTNGVEITWQP